jgi:hemolysin activation/secretion protein/AraC-like DNA-binding protein
MPSERHLILQELTLLPSAELRASFHGWMVTRLADGAGYWLYQGAARELAIGDMLVVTRISGGIIRASLLGPLKLQFFMVQPRLLNGVLAVTDWQQLEACTGAPTGPSCFWAAADPLARRFADLATQPARVSLSFRCRLLQLWADAVAAFGVGTFETARREQLPERLHEMLTEMSEAELVGCSLGDLATQLQCSERHLSRMFHHEFGVPFRVRQAETRLLRAGQLLEQTDAKIVSIAYESGYRHLGLFNAMFKKRFGVTPSEWRKRARRKPLDRLTRAAARGGLLIMVLSGLLAPAAFGQTNAAATLTNAPTLQTNVPKAQAYSHPARTDASPAQASAPVAATNAVLKFEVRNYIVRGNTLIRPEIVDSVLKPYTGKEVTIEQVRKAKDDLQNAFRERGFVTVLVTVPPNQQITNATVTLQVIVAPITSIIVINNRYYSSNNVMRALPSLHTNMVLNSHVFQREVDQANANRDRQIYPSIGPGADPGTSELTLKVQDRFPLHGRMELNNYYTPGTPDLRLNFSLQYNNLWNLDHQIGAQYSITPQESKTSSLYVDSIFDEPMIASYSAYYRLPISGNTPLQERVDADPLRFGYNEATHQVVLPPPSGHSELTIFASRSTEDTGIKYGAEQLVTQGSFISIVSQDTGEDITLNSGLGAQLTLPLPEMGPIRSTLSLGANFKLYRLSSFNTNNFIITTTITNSSGSQTIVSTVSNGQEPRYNSVDYLPLSLGWDGSVPDKLGTTFLNANLNFNVPNMFPYDANSNFAQTAYSPKAKADYLTVNLGLSREQVIYREWSVMLTANGQWADMPLISNEQFAMGGLAGVRGYVDGQAYGDRGWRVQIEPRTPLINLGMVDETIPFWVRGSVFMGYGQTYLVDPPTHDTSAMRFWGVGFGVTASVGQHLDGRLTVGWPLLSIPGVDAGTMHIYFSLGMQF